MKSSIHPLLDQWLKLFNHFPQNDPLVNLENTPTIQNKSNLDWTNLDVQKIINTAKESLKTFGTNPLTIVRGRITQIADKKTNIPYLLYETDFKIEKIHNQVICTKREENPTINPYLIHVLKKKYDLDLELEDWLNIDKLTTLNIIVGDKEQEWIGNFHPNRFALRNELTQIIETKTTSVPLQEQLDLHVKHQEKIPFNSADLVFLDDDQISVIKQFQKTNTIVEGPPGTGKTQLLINLIGKQLINNHSTIVCSAKQTALNVLDKRLKTLHLDMFIFNINDSNGLQPIYQSLAEQWRRIERFKPSTYKNEYRKQREDQLQLKLDIWNQKQIIGNGSWLEFKKLTAKYPFEEGEWLSNPATLKELLSNEHLIKEIYHNNWNEFIYGASSLLPYLSYKEIGQKLEEISDFVYELPANTTLNELINLQRKQITFQLFDSQFAKENKELLDPNSKKRIELLKRISRLQKSELQLFNLQQETAHWKTQIPTAELNLFKEQYEYKNWFRDFKLKRSWSKMSTSPYELAFELIQNELHFRKTKENHEKLVNQLSKYTITNSNEAAHFSLQLKAFTSDQWTNFQTLCQEEKLLFKNWTQNTTQTINSLLKFNWQVEKKLIIQIKKWKVVYQEMAFKSKEIASLPINLIKSLPKASAINQYMANQLKTHWINFQGHYPELAKLQTEGINKAIKQIIEDSEHEQTVVVERIYANTKKTFDYYHFLLATPNNKLSKEENLLKQNLKKGKALLVKEFNKQKQHIKLRTLLSSSAKLWIDLLQPIHFTNPIQLATHCPLDKEMYNIAIIDEASQILASNSTGILFRSQHVIIAGDEKQMQPKTFFHTNEDQESLMNRAKYVLPTIKLTHHYRSQHADLIEFSNQHFYDNNLTVFPKQNQQTAIQCSFVNGQFIDRKNELEADKIAQIIETKIKQSDSLGIVAFSQNQIDLIRKKLKPELLSILIEKEEQAKLFMLPLEKIQGDECEDLIISTTYGPDENGKLRQQYGLLSLEGGLNRLNVLATRASKTIHVVTSLKNGDILMTTNPNTYKFGLWLNYIEQKANCKALKDKKDTICIPLHESLSLREILIQTIIYTKRGWKVEYI